MNVNLAQLLDKLKIKKCDFYIISTFDEYLNEYCPERNKRLKYITNFSGSNGIALLSKKKNYIFTDGRYLLQAEKEVADEFKVIDLAAIDFFSFVRNKIKNKRLLIDFKIFKINFIKKLEVISKDNCLEILHDENNLIDQIWKKRPVDNRQKFFSLDKKITGLSVSEKKKKIIPSNDNILIISTPESVCWLLNIRGYDLPHTPIVFSRAIVSRLEIKLFINKQKIPLKWDNKINIKVFESECFEREMLKLPKNKDILLDEMTPYYYYRSMVLDGKKVTLVKDPCKKLKSKKNNTEIRIARKAHLLDGVALIKYFYWLDNQEFDSRLNEYNVAKKLEKFRSENGSFFSLSFPTISAVGSNGSIIHYNPSKKSKLLKKGELYLCDSGAQYLGATTDVTRTIILGKAKPKYEYILNYTKVLKGHLNLMMSKFPINTMGYQLDSIARYFLWQSGLDYSHGTGHGVGSFLGVHEGPQSISKKSDNIKLTEGMILSNEPGYYKNKKYGIRIENLILVKKSKFKNFLEFENLTICPYDRTLIDVKLLSESQRTWLNNYHLQVYSKLSKYVSGSILNWLYKVTRKL